MKLLCLLLLVPAVGLCATPEAKMTKAQKESAWKAVESCQLATQLSLHDPSSAEFPRISRSFRELDGSIYRVQVEVRARNGFNALRLATMECKVANGKLLSIKQIK